MEWSLENFLEALCPTVFAEEGGARLAKEAAEADSRIESLNLSDDLVGTLQVPCFDNFKPDARMILVDAESQRHQNPQP